MERRRGGRGEEKKRKDKNEMRDKKGKGASAYVLYDRERIEEEVDSGGRMERPAELWTHSGFLQVVPAGTG